MAFRVDISGDKELLKAIEEEKIKINTVVKKIVIEFFSRIIKKTPVDTGAARANWLVSFNSEIEDTSDQTDGVAAIKNMTTKILKQNLNKTHTIILNNNLPYIEVLEDGSSTQAPEGMVKTTIPELEGLIKEGTEELKK